MEKVLIIDDDEMDLQVMNILCSSEGYDVIKTADGPQGINLYKQHNPAFVFLDIGLPTLNGIEVLKEIKKFDPNARIALITGYGSDKVVKDAYRIGVVDFIEKTWDVELMMERIKMVLNAYGPQGVR